MIKILILLKENINNKMNSIVFQNLNNRTKIGLKVHTSIHLGLIISHFSNYKATHRFYHYLTKWEHLCPGLNWNLKITLLFSNIRNYGDDGANVNLHIYLNAIWIKIFKIENGTKSIPKYFTIFDNIIYNICINSRILYNS